MFINKKSLTKAFNTLKELIFRKFTIKVKISDLQKANLAKLAKFGLSIAEQ